MFGIGGLFPGMGGGIYDANYRAYPVAFIEKESAETGDKVILPPSALEKLASMHVEYPMLFKVENKREKRSSHCGVLEFISQEGVCYMPHWMMENLLLREGDLVNLRNVSLPKGTFVKIQPHTSDFLDISNPKAVLETSMRLFTCLTEGDTFVINYNNRSYHIDVIEVKPRGAVSVVETDLSVDFAPPKDYVEPDYKALAAAAAAKAEAANDVKPMETEQASVSAPEAAEPEVPTFFAFGGSGKRLDGKAAAPSNPVAVPIAPTMRKPGDPLRSAPEAPAAKPSSATTGQKAGKVVGGDGLASSNRLAARLASKSGTPGQPPPPVPKPAEPPAAEASKFSAFGGKARSLKD